MRLVPLRTTMWIAFRTTDSSAVHTHHYTRKSPQSGMTAADEAMAVLMNNL